MSKKSFYCWYLGFTEAQGQQGQNRAYDLIKNLINYQNYKQGAIPPSKVTLHLSEKTMTLIDSSQSGGNNSQQKKSRKSLAASKAEQAQQKSYSIAYDSITFVGRLADPQFSDIVTCIIKNNSMRNLDQSAQGKSPFYLHAFRCDSEESSKKMEQYLNYFRKLYFKKIEKQQLKQKEEFLRQSQNSKVAGFVRKEEYVQQPASNGNLKENFIKRQMFKITDRFHNHETLNSSAGTQSSTSQIGNEAPYYPPAVVKPPATSANSNNQFKNHFNPSSSSSKPNQTGEDKIYDDIHQEITGKLQAGEPFLFPPKDYSEIHLKHGDLSERENRRCLNEKIVGELALKIKTQPVIREHAEQPEPLLNSSRDTRMSTGRSVDFNSLSFNEQATQVLNYLDEIVDSVDDVYKPPAETAKNIYKFEPPEKMKVSHPVKEEDEPYEPYEPVNTYDNYSRYSPATKYNMTSHNPTMMADNIQSAPSAYKGPSHLNSFLKRTPIVETMNEGYSNSPAANNGVRSNAYPVLGNYTPKIYPGGLASSNNVQNSSNQVIYRPLKNGGNTGLEYEKENNYQKMRQLATSDESIYVKSNNNNSNRNIHEAAVNHSLNSLMNVDEPVYSKGGLRRTNKQNNNSSNVYVSSQFILKPAGQNQGGDFKNYVHVDNYQSPKSIIDVNYGHIEQSRRKINIPSTSKSYEIHDIYY